MLWQRALRNKKILYICDSYTCGHEPVWWGSILTLRFFLGSENDKTNNSYPSHNKSGLQEFAYYRNGVWKRQHQAVTHPSLCQQSLDVLYSIDSEFIVCNFYQDLFEGQKYSESVSHVETVSAVIW